VIETKSTLEGVVQVDVCSSCHPFFTGKQKLLDTAGRIDGFKKKFGTKVAFAKAAAKQSKKPVSIPTPAAQPAKKPAGSGIKTTLSEKFQAAKEGANPKKS
jgi:large subunit ribosomal protein L31